MSCPTCELARELEHHARLVAQEVEDIREAERLNLTPEERQEIEEEEALLSYLLDRIVERRYSAA